MSDKQYNTVIIITGSQGDAQPLLSITNKLEDELGKILVIK